MGAILISNDPIGPPEPVYHVVVQLVGSRVFEKRSGVVLQRRVVAVIKRQQIPLRKVIHNSHRPARQFKVVRSPSESLQIKAIEATLGTPSRDLGHPPRSVAVKLVPVPRFSKPDAAWAKTRFRPNAGHGLSAG